MSLRSTITVEQGVDAVSAAIQRAEDEYDFYTRGFLAAPESFRYDISCLFSEGTPFTFLKHCLNQRQDEIQNRLQAICGDSPQPADVRPVGRNGLTSTSTLRRIVSARFLTRRSDPIGIATAVGILESGSAEDRQELFRDLALFDLRSVAEQIPLLVDAISRLTSDENKDIARAATDAMQTLKYVCGDVVEEAATNSATSKTLPNFNGELDLYTVADSLSSDNAAAVGAALQWIAEHFPWEEASTHRGYADGVLSNVIQLLAQAGTLGAELLRRFLNSQLNATYRSTALTSLAEAIGDDVSKEIIAGLNDDDSQMIQAAVRSLGSVSNSSLRDRLLEQAITITNARNDGALQIEIARILVEGEDSSLLFDFVGRMDAAQFQNQPSPNHRPRPLSQLVKRMKDLGIGKPVTPDDFADAIRGDAYVPGTGSMNRWVQFALEQAGVFVMFEASPERGDDDLLLQSFVEASHGVFSPTAVLMERPRPEVDESGAIVLPDPYNFEDEELTDENASFKLQFVMNERVYWLTMNHDDGWLDLSGYLEWINRAMEDAGREERFIPFESGSTSTICIFGVPEAVEALAREFTWPSCRNAEQIIKNAKAWVNNLYGD